MKIKVVNFETLSKYYKPYQDGISKINDVKKSFIEKLDPFKRQMEDLITKANSGVEMTKEQEAKFQELQNQAVEIDEEYKFTMRKMNDELSKAIYSELSQFISDWSDKNDIDMVIGSQEVVTLKPEHDVTSDIIEIVKQNNLYVE